MRGRLLQAEERKSELRFAWKEKKGGYEKGGTAR